MRGRGFPPFGPGLKGAAGTSTRDPARGGRDDRRVRLRRLPVPREGWNLGLLECMSVGLNVIATAYSAHTEFATEANCRLVRVDETEPAHDGQWCKGQGNWAKLGRPRWSRWSITCAKSTG